MKYPREDILQQDNIVDFIDKLKYSECDLCELSQHGGPLVVSRGNPFSSIVLVGEALGKVEEEQERPFVGPAGQLLDKIMGSIDIFTPSDMFISNICLHRPRAPEGSGKQNYTPSVRQCKTCGAYVRRMIELIDPKIVIAAGRPAAITLYGLKSATRMGDIAGKFIEPDDSLFNGRRCFTIYHPAWMLHTKRKGQEAYEEAKRLMWAHIQVLKAELEKLNIEIAGPTQQEN